jgi:hypothetical protein
MRVTKSHLTACANEPERLNRPAPKHFSIIIGVGAAAAATIMCHHMSVPTAHNDNFFQPPPKSPAPIVAVPRADNDNNPMSGGPTGMSGAGRANFMAGPLPDGSTMKWVTTSKGKRFRVNPEAAPHLLGFVNDLEEAGAPITEIGGYNLRHIAGSARWSACLRQRHRRLPDRPKPSQGGVWRLGSRAR